MITVKIPAEYSGKILLEALAKEGYFVNAACGGGGTCGKCVLNVNDGGWKEVKSCRFVVPEGGIEVRLEGEEKRDRLKSVGRADVAIDIGTTTVEMMINGESVAFLNPQRSFGSDVVLRINKASEGRLDEMRNVLLSKIRSVLDEIGVSEIGRLFVCGNPTMTHIFAGVTPVQIGEYPYKPEFDEFHGKVPGIVSEETVILPGGTKELPGSGFIGSDVISAATYAGIKDGEMIVDFGTNGEIILSNGGKFYACSAAAGPCFEGGNITNGTGGVKGAIKSVTTEKGTLKIKTIDGAKACGICGSGLVSGVAALRKMNAITQDGYLEKEFDLGGVSLFPQDVRAYQLGKSAILSGIISLCEYAGIKTEDVKTVFVAGGLGKYLDAESAVETGLLPKTFRGKIKAVGNAALRGTYEALNDKTFEKRLRENAKKVVIYDLGASERFKELFLENMNLEEY